MKTLNTNGKSDNPKTNGEDNITPISSPPKATQPTISILTIRELLTKQFPPSDSILGGELLDKSGAMLISGPQKIGKSLFANQLALSIVDGESLLGFQPGAGDYSALILQAEISERRMQERFSKQTSTFSETTLDRVHQACVYSRVKLDNPVFQKELETIVTDLKPSVLVFDPLINFHSQDENDATQLARVTTVLDRLRALGPAVVVVHHHSKGSARQPNPGYKARGSSALAGWYDSHIVLEWKDPKTRTVRMQFELRHGEAPEDMVIRLNPTTMLFEVEENEAGQVSMVVAAVAELGHSNAERVGKHCDGNTREWARKWLNRGVGEGKLVRTDGKEHIFSRPERARPEMKVDITPERVVVSTNTATDSEADEDEWPAAS